MKRWVWGVWLVVLGLGPVWAHRLLVEGGQDGAEAWVEAFFGDGTPAAGAKVEVRRGAEAEVVAQGTTDAGGRFVFAVGAGGACVVEVVDVSLHRAELGLELRGSVAEVASAVAVPAEVAPPSREAAEERGERPRWPALVVGLVVIGALGIGMSWAQRRGS